MHGVLLYIAVQAVQSTRCTPPRPHNFVDMLITVGAIRVESTEIWRSGEDAFGAHLELADEAEFPIDYLGSAEAQSGITAWDLCIVTLKGDVEGIEPIPIGKP